MESSISWNIRKIIFLGKYKKLFRSGFSYFSGLGRQSAPSSSPIKVYFYVSLFFSLVIFFLYCTFFKMHFLVLQPFCVALSSCCISFMLHFFRVVHISCLTISMLHFFHIVLFSCCTFSSVALFPRCFFSSVALFSHCFLCVALFSCCTAIRH